MHGDLIIHFSKAQQSDIARHAMASRGQLSGRLGGVLKGRRRRLRPALPGGGMLPSWHHGSPARGS
jgi:hypothetical protein